MRAQQLILLFLMPFIFYVIPIADIHFIPEITGEHVLIAICVIVSLFYLFVFLKNLKQLSTLKRKIIIAGVLLLFIYVHYILSLAIHFAYNGLESSKQIIQEKIQYTEPTIYVIEEAGFLGLHKASVIGYSSKYSPFLTVHYKTVNRLKLITGNPNELIIEEYRYDRSVGNGKVLILRPERKKIEIRLLKVIPSDLK